jgi:diguanylate cyclase (GGDEF)-like protein
MGETRSSGSTSVSESAAVVDEVLARPAAVVVIRGNGLGRRYAIGTELVVGYDADSDIVIDDYDAVLYARLVVEDSNVVLRRQFDSEIVIKVNEASVETARLNNGDIIQVGFSLLKFIQADDQIGVDSAFHDEIFRLSTIDPVTQVYNRRYFTEAFEREVSRARRYERSLSLVLVEVDGLMGLSNQRGKTAGDELMHGVADLVRARARKSDVIGHYEREVLSMILPEVGANGAKVAAEGLRGRLEQEVFPVDGGDQGCTISIGVAELDPSHDTVDDLVRLANRRLWVAKDSGGNRVVSDGG